MKHQSLCFAAGVLVFALTPSLPSPLWLVLAPLLVLSLCFPPAAATRLVRCSAWLLLGALWGLAAGHWQMSHTLPAAFEGEDVVVQGRLVGLPDADWRRQRVLMQVDRVASPEGEPLALDLRRLQVSWYGGPPLAAGEHWQLTVRVRPPRGFVNPAGFDYQLWLLRQRVDAVGYVRESEDNRRLRSVEQTFGAGVLSLGHWRQSARQWLQSQPELTHTGLLQALLLGDRSGLDDEQWQRLQSTGTNHLIAISGLHVGFVALIGFGLGALLGRLLNLFCHRVPAHWPGHLLALLLALGYSALAGFALPTQRALVMVLAVQLYLLNRRRLQADIALMLALVAVLILDPLAGFDMGFWLSFTAVAVLLWAFVGRYPAGRRWPGQALVRAQWVVFLGLLVPLTLLTQGATLLAPIANLVAIPLVTFAVVPWLLLSAALYPLWPALSQWLLSLADGGLVLLEGWLGALEQLVGDSLAFSAQFTGPSLVLALGAVALLLMPRGFPARLLGYPALLLAVVLPGPPSPALRVAFLDVGHGLASVVQTPNHSLVYDTGLRYSDRLEAGGAIIAPYLRHRGIHELDATVVSHRHSDHSGGLLGLKAAMPIGDLWLGEPLPDIDLDGKNCHNQHSWRWDDVAFQFLFAGLPRNPNSNNHSCVLLIRYGDQTLLLTGDIEREVEWRLVGSETVPEALTVVQIPHHGSDSSSTPEWVRRVRPQIAVAPAGYQSRHGHPTDTVVERYRERGSRVLNTAELGAVEIEWDHEGELTKRHYRQYRQRYWYR